MDEDKLFRVRKCHYWILRTPIWPKKCSVTNKSIWLKPAYRGTVVESLSYRYDFWVDKFTMQTLILKGLVTNVRR